MNDECCAFVKATSFNISYCKVPYYPEKEHNSLEKNLVWTAVSPCTHYIQFDIVVVRQLNCFVCSSAASAEFGTLFQQDSAQTHFRTANCQERG